MKRGARVYRNLAPSGNTDLIFQKDGLVLRVDVKAMRQEKGDGKWRGSSPGKAPENVHYVYVHPETWKPRWNSRDVPAHWEDFWK